jgi:hypothetical protein
VIEEFPELPVTTTYEALRATIEGIIKDEKPKP